MFTRAIIPLLRELTGISGIAGMEDDIIRHLRDELTIYADETQIDPPGNVIARFGDSAPHIAFLAHMDTVGFLVKSIVDDGMLQVVPVGGVNLKALPGTAVHVGDRVGIFGVRSQHLASLNEAGITPENLFIEIESACEIEITTPARYIAREVRPGDKLYASAYLDNRAGCAILLMLAKQLREIAHEGTLYLIGTAQEETTCMGAYYALANIQPDCAIFIDGTVSYDTPETRNRGAIRLGKGPVLTSFLYVSGLNGWHAHPKLREHLKQIAIEQQIPYQQDAIRGLMSDAKAALPPGIPSAIIGLPMRGKHAPLETAHLDDLYHAAKLALAILQYPLPELSRG